MDSSDLLAREEEFRKLNKQLEKKTVSLMKEIENVMQKQDIFSDFSRSLSSQTSIIRREYHCDTNSPSNSTKNTPKHTQKAKEINIKIENNTVVDVNNDNSVNETTKASNCESTRTLENNENVLCDCFRNNKRSYLLMDEIQFLNAFVNVNVQEKVLPQSFLKERYSVESVCKFLASKIRLMQEQIDRMQSVIEKKSSQCEKHLCQYAELEGEKLKLLNQVNNYRGESFEVKNRCTLLQNKLIEKEAQYKEQRSELDKLTAANKKLKVKIASAEAKSANHEDEVVRLKQQLDVARNVEKEFRDSFRAHSATQKSAISRHETTIKQLNVKLSKLQQLVENLKRQNEVLSTDVMLQGLEKDYCKLLLGED